MCFNVNSQLATSSFTIFHILFITCFPFARFTPHIRLHEKEWLYLLRQEKLFYLFLGLRGKAKKRAEENESNTLSRKIIWWSYWLYILKHKLYLFVCKQKYLELRIRVIIIMKLNEGHKATHYFGPPLKYVVTK